MIVFATNIIYENDENNLVVLLSYNNYLYIPTKKSLVVSQIKRTLCIVCSL